MFVAVGAYTAVLKLDGSAYSCPAVASQSEFAKVWDHSFPFPLSRS